MCGIAGVAGRGNAPALLRDMLAKLAHRGPDGEGCFERDGIALGHRRLAILDLSPEAAQPMTSRNGRWTIVFNGEIFNYLELRDRLGAFPFRSASDTEVLLEACAAWGVETALRQSVGMFAFALWDSWERELVLVRDRLGEKPLVYFEGAAEGRPFLAFSSEMKALRPFHSGRIDPEALDVYLALGYVPAPLGIFRGTRKLPAGHLVRWRNAQMQVRRWWFPELAATGQPPTRPASIAHLRALVADAVRLRLRADVPLAVALSGGLDSSVVALEMARHGLRPQALTVIFDGDQTDLPFARSMASWLGIPHEIIPAESSDLAAQIGQTVAEFDEPFADSSAVAALALARAVAGRYKVILDGDGGDEAFAGYSHYEFIGVKQAAKSCAAAAGLVDGRGRSGVYIQSRSTFRAAERLRLLNGHRAADANREDALRALIRIDEFHRVAPQGALKHALWSDRHLHLANSLTYKADLALGSQGIEGRAPLLDHRILEWTQNLGDQDLVRGRQKKVLLREAYRNELPPEIEARPKHGFGAPVAAWLAGPLKELVRASVPCRLLAPELQHGTAGQRLWTLLALSGWAEHSRASW
jgi:asparagine synthase (glutamine-hydrolysing)